MNENQTKWWKTVLLPAAKYSYQVCHLSSFTSPLALPFGWHSTLSWCMATFWKCIDTCSGVVSIGTLALLYIPKTSHYLNCFCCWKWCTRIYWSGPGLTWAIFQDQKRWMIIEGKLTLLEQWIEVFTVYNLIKVNFVVFYWLELEPFVSEFYFKVKVYYVLNSP